MRKSAFAVAFVALAFALAGPGSAAAAPPAFGQNVIVFTPSMPQSQIQATLDTISTQQVPNQFGSQRYAVLFEPGTYGSAQSPLVFQLGYYTQVAGLGATPSGVVINGAVDVFNQCDGSGPCDGLTNFWRSLSNLTLNVTLPGTAPAYAPENGEDDGCKNSNDLFAVSQASPVRSVIVNGALILQDYCNRGFVSGGFFANDELNGFVGNFGQQQYFTRNSNIGQWSNVVWNQVFLGDNGAPATAFGPGVGQYTNVPSARVSQEPPFLTTDAAGNWSVFLPAVQRNSVGPNYAGGSEAGTSIPISRFFIASPATPVASINAALARSQNLILTPGDLPATAADRGRASTHRGARPRFRNADPDERQHCARNVERAGDQGVGPDRRRRAGELPDPRADRRQERRRHARPERSDAPLRRVLPHRRCRARPGDNEPRGERRQRDPRRHLGLARGPRRRRRLDQQHGGHGRRRQRRQRLRVWAVRRALPEVRGDLERPERPRRLLPERDAVRSAVAGGVDVEPHDRRLRRVPRVAERDELPGLRHGQLLVLQPGRADRARPRRSRRRRRRASSSTTCSPSSSTRRTDRAASCR